MSANIYFLVLQQGIPKVRVVVLPVWAKSSIAKTTKTFIPFHQNVFVLFFRQKDICNKDIYFIYFIFWNVVRSTFFKGFLRLSFDRA